MHDETGMDESDEVLITKPLEWESQAVSTFKRSLDDSSLKQKSPLAKIQMRKIGMPSSRPKPQGEFPSWAFTKD